MKKILAMLLMVSLLAVSIVAFADTATVPQFTGNYGEIVCRYAHVRPEKGAKTEVVRLNHGDQFEIIGEDGDWYQLKYVDEKTGKEYTGWLWNAYVVYNPKHLVMDGSVVIRACPGVNNLIIGTAEKDESFTIIGEDGSYYVISFREGVGYIRKDSDMHLLEDEQVATPTATPDPNGLG